MLLYYITNLEIENFTEVINCPGLYNICEAAIDMDQPVIITGAEYKGKSYGLLTLIPEKDSQTGTITLSSFSATIGTDDNLTPIGTDENPEPVSTEENTETT